MPFGNQNGPFQTVSMLATLFRSNSPAQAVQVLLNNNRINQQQADVLTAAITNGNGEQVVQQMMNSGQMSQEQFNQLSSMAHMFGQFMNK